MEKYALQIKYRKIIENNIPFGELCSFQALTFGTSVKNIYKGIFFTSCIDVCDELKNDKYISIVHDSLNNKCDELFWKNVREFIGEKKLTIYKNMEPLPHQINIIKQIKNHYELNNYGRINVACGTGKTFMGYWVTVRELKLKKIFIVVPSLYLLSQTFETWQKELQLDNYHFILIGSDMDKKELDSDSDENNRFILEYEPTTDKEEIRKQMLENTENLIVITTYHSSKLLIDASKSTKTIFDMGIYDEAHRTVGEKDKCFTSLLTSNIEKKKLFMTATEKIYNYDKNDETILSMDNEKIYGKLICKYSIKEAIDDKVLVDYKIIAPFINNLSDCEYRIVDDNGKCFNNNIIVIGILIIKAMEEFKFKHLLHLCTFKTPIFLKVFYFIS